MERMANLYRSEMVEKYMKSYLAAHNHEAIVFLKHDQDWVVKISEIEVKADMAILKFQNPSSASSEYLRAAVCEPSYDDLFANIDWDCENRLLATATGGHLNLNTIENRFSDAEANEAVDPNTGFQCYHEAVNTVTEAVIETSVAEEPVLGRDGLTMTSL
jgi:hypothetical protein